MGNSDVKLKHKVQLRRKVSVENPTSHPTPNTPKSKKMIWIMLGGIMVLCIVGYCIFFMPDNAEQKSVVAEDNTEVENNSVPSNTTDSIETVKEGVEDTESKVVESSNDNESTTLAESGKSTDVKPTVNANISVRATNVSNDVEAEAIKVIRGDYGIGQERKDKLGDKYQTIQNRVNELKREGLF